MGAAGGQARKGIIPFRGPKGGVRKDFLEEALMFEAESKRQRKHVKGNHNSMARISLGFCKTTEDNNYIFYFLYLILCHFGVSLTLEGLPLQGLVNSQR